MALLKCAAAESWLPMETETSPASGAVLKRNVLKMRTESNTSSKPNRERIIFLVMVLQIKTKYINYPKPFGMLVRLFRLSKSTVRAHHSNKLFKFMTLKQPKHEIQKSGHYRFHRADYPDGGDEWRDETFRTQGSC
jgi:hypothetical protein